MKRYLYPTPIKEMHNNSTIQVLLQFMLCNSWVPIIDVIFRLRDSDISERLFLLLAGIGLHMKMFPYLSTDIAKQDKEGTCGEEHDAGCEAQQQHYGKVYLSAHYAYDNGNSANESTCKWEMSEQPYFE